MILGIQTMDEAFTKFFTKLFANFHLSDFGLIFYGITLGFLLALAIYGFFLLKSIKKDIYVAETESLLTEPELTTLVNKIKDEFAMESEGLTIGQQMNCLGDAIKRMTHDIAQHYYPTSKYPMCELSAQELITYLHYVSNRINQLLSKPLLRGFQKMTISQVFKILDMKKNVEDVKIVQAVKKAQSTKIPSTIWASLHYANPLYWMKKMAKQTTTQFISKRIFGAVLDIVADETNKAYSKVLFNKEYFLQDEELASLNEE
jgi:hypothetical protein